MANGSKAPRTFHPSHLLEMPNVGCLGDDETYCHNAVADHPLLFHNDLADGTAPCSEPPSPACREVSHPPVPVFVGGSEHEDKGQGSAAMSSTPAAVNEVLDREFEDFHYLFSQLASRVDLPTNQVISRFSKGIRDQDEGPSKQDNGRGHTRAGELDEREDHARVRKRLAGMVGEFFTLTSILSLSSRPFAAELGCDWAARRLFPWKNFPSKLARSGVVCHGWPDHVHLPGEDRESRLKGGSRGISDLTLVECASLFAALNDTSKDGLCFKLVADRRGQRIFTRHPATMLNALEQI